MTPLPIPPNILGTLPDRVIAEQYGVRVGTVQRLRRALGKPGVNPGTRGPPSRAAAYDHLLGYRSDAEIGRLAGCAASVIRKRRMDRKIAACPHPGRVVPKRHPVKTLSPEHEALLGTVSDAEVARRSGIQQRTVRTIRTRLGIAAWVPPKAEAPAPRPPRVRTPRPKREPVAKVAPVPKAPPVPKPAPAPRAPSVREQLREQEPEPVVGSRVRMELVTPTPVADLSLFSARERTIIRAVRAGKPMEWIRATYRVTDDEIAELVAEVWR